MPIREYLSESGFEAAVIESMNAALAEVCASLDDRFLDSASVQSSKSPGNPAGNPAISKAAYDSNFGSARLGLTDKTDDLTIMVANRIIDLAKSGERDPERLKAAVLKSFQN
jgi:hypothetical protein